MKKLLLILLPLLLAGCNEKLSDEDIIRQNVEKAVMSMYSTDFIQTIDLSGFAIVNLSFEDIKKTGSYIRNTNELKSYQEQLSEAEYNKENDLPCNGYIDCDDVIQNLTIFVNTYNSNIKRIEELYTSENYTIIHEYNVLVNNKVIEYIKRKYYINENYEIFSSDIILAEER